MTISPIGFSSRILASLEAIERLADGVQAHQHFQARTIRRRRGGGRNLYKPDEYLSQALKKTAELLEELNPPFPDHVHGFIRNRSTVTNARAHLAKPVVLRVDIADYFPSISSDLVEEAFARIDFAPAAASLARRLTTVDGALAVGFHPSPIISNMVFRDTDHDLSSLARERGYAFTRYVDDLVFSGNVGQDFADEVGAVLAAHGWQINPAKTSFMKRGGKQFVTGLSVNDAAQPRLPLRLKREMRWKLHMIERVGFETYMESFNGMTLSDYGPRLIGLARYMAAVEPRLGVPYLERLNALDLDYFPDEEEETYNGMGF